jgi:hypothetical protein
MTSESLLEETLRQWSKEAQVPTGLADRALTRRRRIHLNSVALAAGATAVVVVAGILVPKALPHNGPEGLGPVVEVESGSPKPTPTSPSEGPSREPVASPVPVAPGTLPESLAVRTDTENAPPKQLIAAGRIIVPGYRIWGQEKIGKKSDRRHDTWFLYNAGTGMYERTDWAALDVAPGMKFAAVLERDLPARRVGVLDMATGQVVKWIDLDHAVADVSWSPDATKLLTTAYDSDPSIRTGLSADGNSWQDPPSQRTGFHVIDVATGAATFHPVPQTDRFKSMGGEWNFGWSDDGTLVWETNPGESPGEVKDHRQRLYYDLEGRPHDGPTGEVETFQQAGVSPNGKLYASDPDQVPMPVQVTPGQDAITAYRRGPETAVRDVASGKVVGRQQMLQLLAWADDEHLIALQCMGTCKDEFDAYLVLITIDGTKSVRLSGAMENSQRPGSWHPLLTRR